MIKKEKNKKNWSIVSVIVSSLFILGGITCLFVDWYKDYRLNKIDSNSVEIFFEEETPIATTEEIEETKTTPEVINYIAVLEIPKISLKRGLVDINSRKNNVNYNIEILDPSDMPNITNGNLILASHSGSGRVAFFRNLYKMEIDDYSYIYYENEKYTYQVTKIYEEDKDGLITLKRNKDKTTLTMITCSQTNKTKHIVVISEFVSKDSY